MKLKKWVKYVITGIFLITALYTGIQRIDSKKGFMLDEMISYVFANSEYTSFYDPYTPQSKLYLYKEQNVNGASSAETVANEIKISWKYITDAGYRDEFKNEVNSIQAGFAEPQWISKDTFEQYVDATGKNRFDFISVVYNIHADAHPPLYYLILHLVSSIYGGQFTSWIGGGINLVCILGTCILLIWGGYRLYKAPAIGFASAVLYFFSKAGYESVIFNRMYAMAAFFATASAMIVLQKMKRNTWKHKNSLLVLTILFGSLTHYYFLVYLAFLMTAAGIVLLIRKQMPSLVHMCLSALIGVVLSFVLFPFSLQIIFNDPNGRGGEAFANFQSGFGSYWSSLKQYCSLLFRQIADIPWIIFIIIIVIAIIAAHFRKQLTSGTAGKFILSFALTGYILLIAKIAPYITDRYIMMIYPLVSLLICSSLYDLMNIAPLGKTASTVILIGASAIMAVTSVYNARLEYRRSDYRNELAVAEEHSNLPLLYIYNGDMYSHYPEFLAYSRTLVTTLGELNTRSEDDILGKSDIAVVCESREESEAVINLLKEKYGYVKAEKELDGSAYIWCSDVYLMNADK